LSKKILVTGANGFLGKYVSKVYKDDGYHVTGLGHGEWISDEKEEWGIDDWICDDISFESLISLNQVFDLIVHCGGSGSVAFSLAEPKKDFERSVNTTLAVLEYVRLYNPNAQIIYPSSPAVQGVHDNTPIKEDDPCNPVSPYGLHKKIAEELCISYSQNFNLDIKIVRFFSIYGEYLKKQLLWDACKKLISSSLTVEFWGTGDETRDWIYVKDAAYLVKFLTDNIITEKIINGGVGIKHTVNETLLMLSNALGVDKEIVFNKVVKEGDPKYYWADTKILDKYGWCPSTSLEDGILKYASWFRSIND